ncbi:unannotated protein [freshwater metagenome]|uniref:Unannotated protein n=1 Tax=freshwater metagenome TaxID=449393 RepID=A0A6J6E5T7_9ZZZZ
MTSDLLDRTKKPFEDVIREAERVDDERLARPHEEAV